MLPAASQKSSIRSPACKSVDTVLRGCSRAPGLKTWHGQQGKGRSVGAGAQTSVVDRPTHDRILRYPDGLVRTIRYPGNASQQSTQETNISSEGQSSDWHICGENDSSCTFDPTFDDECSLPGAAPVEKLWGAAAPGTEQPPEETKPKIQPKDEFNQLPSSPAALLEFLASNEYQKAAQERTDKIQQSFQILHGCPWVAQRPVLTLVVPKRGKDAPAAYTLPVAVEQDGNGAELAKLVGDPSLAGKLKHRYMQDGIIAFIDARVAMKFRDELQAAGTLSASLTEVDSHTLFRASADAKHAVVLVGPETASDPEAELAAIARGAHLDAASSGDLDDVFVPTPAELASALRGPSPMQDW